VVLVGISKWPYAAVAAALEVIPRTLAQVSYNTAVYCLPAVAVLIHSRPPLKSIATGCCVLRLLLLYQHTAVHR
jgi:hypothetical protein